MLALAGCGGAVAGVDVTPSPSAGPPALQAVIVSSYTDESPCSVACVVTGRDVRIGVFITDSAGEELADVSATAVLYAIDASNHGRVAGPKQNLLYHGEHLQLAGLNRGVYSVHYPITNPGKYVIRVTAKHGSVEATSDAGFIALASDPGIPVGAVAPRSHNPILGPGVDIATIDTGNPPDQMHYARIVDSIDAHHPMVIYFGTPGFCQSKTCAPEVQVVQALQAKYQSRGVDFIHVETYQGGRPDNTDLSKATLSATFKEWKLTTEPWVFVVNQSGQVFSKYSGATGADEISPDLDRVLAG